MKETYYLHNDGNIKVYSEEGSHSVAIDLENKKLGTKLTLFMPTSKAHELSYEIDVFMANSPVRSLHKVVGGD